jgi:cell division protein FtsX
MMIWPHVIMARGFLRRHWPLWTLHVLLVSGLAFASIVTAVNAVRTCTKIDEVAQEVAIDIAVRDGVSSEQIDELTAMLRRRPDVVQSIHLDRQKVWQMFQSEMGLDFDSTADGMADIAALPEVVRVHFRSEYVKTLHVHDVVHLLHRRMQDRIEQVLIPGQAISNVELDKAKFYDDVVRIAVIGLLLAVVLAVSIGRIIRAHNHRAIATRIGRTAVWLRLGPFAGLTLGTVVGALLGSLSAWLPLHLAAPLSTFYLIPAAGAVVALTLLIVVVHAGMVFVPSSRPRGWQ